MTHTGSRHLRRTVRAALCGAASLLALAAVAGPDSQPAGDSPFTADAYIAHVKYLADDKLEGRLPGTPGIELAAEYIARQFESAGLTPAGDDGTWFQTFEVRRGKRLVPDEALLEVGGLDEPLKVGEDWTPLPFSLMEDAEGPLAFAGYGIEADLHEYNDYAGFDATGKILLILRYEPPADDPQADFGGRDPSRYALFNVKAATAAIHGAKALLIVNPRRGDEEDKLFEFTEEWAKRTFDLPMAQISRRAAEVILKRAGQPDLARLQEKLDQERKPLSADLKLDVKLRVGIRPNMIPTRNVVGLLKGAADVAESIVVGAHYDHLGRTPPFFDPQSREPVIHNGADDNASGTAGVIELARVLGQERGLRRDAYFVAFSAEEMGLLGSKQFVEHPPVPLVQIRAMINFDMIGRLSAGKFTIYGVGTAIEFDGLVRAAAERVGVEYRGPLGGVTGASDHAEFFSHDIPVLFPITGVHKEYHRPEDDWELIDADGAVRILAMFLPITRDLANLSAGPTFQKPTEAPAEEAPIKPGVEHEKEAEQAAARAGAAGAGPSDVQKATRPKTRLGIIPDHAATDQPGVVVDTVLPGGAAKAGGVQDGDRIIRIGERKIQDIYAYMDVLKTFKPGDEVELVLVRKEQELTLKLKLMGSPPPPRGPE